MPLAVFLTGPTGRIRFGVVLACLGLLMPDIAAQKGDFLDRMYQRHEEFRFPGFEARRFQPEQVYAAIRTLEGHAGFDVSLAGQSVQGRPIYAVRWGHGPVRILLWSQMHGDEPTATMAMLDLWRVLQEEKSIAQVRQWKERVTLYFLPLVNPDGAAMYMRRNALGIDLNRDALRRSSPEARMLWHWRDSLQPQWGFNLHDQHRYYSVGGSDLTAALSFLAPPPDQARSRPPQRIDAMKVIVGLDRRLQRWIPGQTARYSDAFEARAFGDQFTAAGTATILIEAGWLTGDEEKQALRRLYFASLVSAMETISSGSYREEKETAYQRMPYIQNRLFELLVRGAQLETGGTWYPLDLAFKREEWPGSQPGTWYADHRLADMGDLDPFSAHVVLDARNMKIVPSMAYGHVLPDRETLRETEMARLIRQGYAVFRMVGCTTADKFRNIPLALRSPEDDTAPVFLPGHAPVFYLEEAPGQLRYLVVNGRLWDLRQDEWEKALLAFLGEGLE